MIFYRGNRCDDGSGKKSQKKAKRVIPGFGLSLGVTITLLSLVVLIPLAALVIYTAQMSPSEFWEAITRERVLASYKVSFITAFIASLINAVMGVILAWVLVVTNSRAKDS